MLRQVSSMERREARREEDEGALLWGGRLVGHRLVRAAGEQG